MDKKVNGIIIEDRRGKHNNHKRKDEKIKNSIREYINSIPRRESHYKRQDSTREYISGDKCLADLYRDYKKIKEDKNEPAANLTMYSRIFLFEFNISFFSSKKFFVIYVNSLKMHQMTKNYQFNHLNEELLI